jgi:hypothetical protein
LDILIQIGNRYKLQSLDAEGGRYKIQGKKGKEILDTR